MSEGSVFSFWHLADSKRCPLVAQSAMSAFGGKADIHICF